MFTDFSLIFSASSLIFSLSLSLSLGCELALTGIRLKFACCGNGFCDVLNETLARTFHLYKEKINKKCCVEILIFINSNKKVQKTISVEVKCCDLCQ